MYSFYVLSYYRFSFMLYTCLCRRREVYGSGGSGGSGTGTGSRVAIAICIWKTNLIETRGGGVCMRVHVL